MKKLFVLVLALFVATPVFAQVRDVETVVNDVWNPVTHVFNANVAGVTGAVTMDVNVYPVSTDPIAHRSYRTAADTADPTIASAVMTGGYKYAVVYVSCDSLAGDGGCTVTPYLYCLPTGAFYGGTSRTVSDDGVFVVEVNQQPLYVSIDSITGTAAGLAAYVYVQRVN